MGYKKITLKGVVWMTSLHFILKSLAILKIVLLTKVLTPHDFGLYGIALMVIGLLETFSDFGVSAFFIQLDKNIKNYANNIFAVQIIRGVILGLLIGVIAIPTASFFKENSLVFLVLISTMVPIVKSFENPYITLFQKDLYFYKEFWIRSVSYVLDFVTSIVLAFIFKNVFGLIVALIISSLLYSVLSWVVIDARPKMKFSKKKIIEILHFAKSISLLGIVNYVATEIDSLVIGKFFSVATLGGYQFTQKISYDPMQDISGIVGKVTFPVYSKMRNDKARLRKAFSRIFISVTFFEGLFALFVFIFAHQILQIASSARWLQYEDFLRIFAVYGFLISSWGCIGSLFFALKKQKHLITLTVIRLIVLLPLIYLAVANHNRDFIITALIISLIFVFPLTFYFIKKELS